MGIVTTQTITAYYDRYKQTEVVFAKDMIQTTGLIVGQVAAKCGGETWPCVLCAASLMGAKIAANPKMGLLEGLQKTKNMMNVRLCFKDKESGSPVTFFLTGKVMGMVKQSADVSIFVVQFIQRPPDFFIIVMGRVLDAAANSAKLKDERIIVTNDSQKQLKLHTKETATFIQAVPRRCVLRELSFGNAKIIMAGLARVNPNEETAIRLDFDDPWESFLIKGRFTSSVNLDGRKDILILSLDFHGNMVPINFKIRLNEYFTSPAFRFSGQGR